MDDKVRIRCPGCTRIFRENGSRVRDGMQVNCLNCNKLITLSRDTEDSFMRRALKEAKDIRLAQDAVIVAAVYAKPAPKRETQ